MKVALAILNGRVSPVFDVSRQALIFEMNDGGATERMLGRLSPDAPASTARRLAEEGVRTLVCGAISTRLAAVFAAQGIRVVPFIAGDVEEVIAAYAAGALPNSSLLMPGCSLEQPRPGGDGEPNRSRGSGPRTTRRRCRRSG